MKLIDGEIGTQLLKYVKEVDGDPLWCSRYNVTAPDAVYKCYMDFMAAGGELIRTNTYQSSVDGFKKHLNLTEEKSEELFNSILDLAHKARDHFVESNPERKIEVWASVGSYGAYLSDGSEYTGTFLKCTEKEIIKSFHKNRLDVILTKRRNAGKTPIDGVAVETIPSAIEAEIVVSLFNEFYPNVNYWISFNCQDGQKTAYNESFKEAVERVWNLAKGRSQIVGVGVNCVDPKVRSGKRFEMVRF